MQVWGPSQGCYVGKNCYPQLCLPFYSIFSLPFSVPYTLIPPVPDLWLAALWVLRALDARHELLLYTASFPVCSLGALGTH